MPVNGEKRSVPDGMSVRHSVDVLSQHIDAKQLSKEVFIIRNLNKLYSSFTFTLNGNLLNNQCWISNRYEL